MEVPAMKCAVRLERTTGGRLTERIFKSTLVSLARNEFRDVLFIIHDQEKRIKIPLKQDELTVHRKFAREGKATVAAGSTAKLFLSNAPPHQLVTFLKSLAAKLAGEVGREAMSARKRLLSGLPQATDTISPVTQKDVNNLKRSEAGGRGLLKMNMATPVSASSAKKRRRLNDSVDAGKENCDPGSATTPLRPRKDRVLSVRRPSARTDLTAEQRYVLEAVKEGKNVFFTGGAGTGKSYLIKKCIGALPPDATVVTASTGVAAYQIGGITLHTFAGIGGGTQPLEQCIEMVRRRKAAVETWKKCRHLIVDEISMVDGRFFSKLEAIARAVRGSERPFGGIQLILTGDFLQLPPVTRRKEDRVFCFETTAWTRCVQVNLELTAVKRQTDDRFVNILKSLRNGECSESDAETLEATRANEVDSSGIVATKLCTHTDNANEINRSELARLPGQAKTFAAVDSDPALASYLDGHTPAEAKIALKVGAQVMLLKNQRVSKGLVNGARGRVVSFDRKTGYPLVRFVCGVTEEVGPEKWVVKASGGVVLTRRQLPLRLAWAFSIHKSQGMTLDCVEISLARVFECGQAYVALSRARSLDAVRITDFSKGCIRADKKVLRFYRDLRVTAPVVQTTLALT